MAFSDGQKARIKYRAQELLAADPTLSQGAAAQQAVSDLFSQQQLQEIFSPPEPIRPEAPEDTRTLEVEDLDLQLRDEERTYIRERSRQLEREGFTPTDAEATARRDLEQFQRRAVPLGYGTVEERAEGFLAPVAEAIVPFSERQETPIGDQQGEIPSGINYDEIQKLFEEQLEMSAEEASAQTDAFRTYILEPRLAKIRQDGLTGGEADRKAMEEAFQVLQDLGTRLSDESTYLQPEDPEGSQDPWIRTFSRQVERGVGVPDLTEEQREYLNATILAEVDREAERIFREERPTTDLYGGDFRLKTKEEIKQELLDAGAVPWWTGENRQAVLDNPEAFTDEGFFTDTTPYGTQKETLGGWMLRSAMMVPNVLAGGAAYLGYEAFNINPDLAEGRRQAREEAGYDTEEGLTGGAILQNIAENRGFFGEAEEAADITNLEGAARYATLAGGFLADLADPSFDIVKGGTTFARGLGRNLSTVNSLYGNLATARQYGGAVADAAARGVNDFADNYVLTAAGRFGRLPAGDFRNFMSAQVTADLATQARLLEDVSRPALDAAADLSKPLRNSNFGVRFAEAAKGGGTVDEALARMAADPTATAGRQAIEEIDRIANNIDETFSAVRRKDVARSLGAAARIDEAVETIIRPILDVDKAASAAASGTKLTRALQALQTNPQAYRTFRTVLMNDLASREVVRATKNIPSSDFENLVAVTKNTFVDPKTARELVKEAQKTELGKLVETIAQNKNIKLVGSSRGSVAFGEGALPQGAAVTGGKTEKRILPAYALTDDQITQVNKIVEELQTFGKLGSIDAALIRETLENTNSITLEDVRKLIDANIDLIAEGRAATGKGRGTLRARDIARLPVSEQVALLMPMEQRSLTRSVARKIYETLTSRTPAAGNLSVGQRQLLQEARTKMSSLDVELRRGIALLKRDKEARAFYGLKPDQDYTIPELVSALTLGAKSPDIDPTLIPAGALQDTRKATETIVGMLNDLFFSKSTKENVFDLFTGTSVSKAGNVFTQEAMDRLAPLIRTASEKARREPNTLFEAMVPVLEEAQRIVASGDPKLLRYPANEITDVAAKKGGIPAEIQLGAYYRSEAQRISREVVSDLINSEVGKGRINIIEELTPDIQQRVAETFGKVTGRPQPRFTGVRNEYLNNIIANRAKKILEGKPLDITAEDIFEVFNKNTEDFRLPLSDWTAGAPNAPAPPQTVRSAESLLRDPNFMRDFGLVSELGADVANGIIRRNGLRGATDPIGDMERLIGELNKRDTDGFRKLNVLFGEDVARQLTDELTEGFDKLRDEILDLVDKGALEYAEAELNALQNFRYLALLNLRPRFHGANLLTGADIFYSTTGKLPRLDDLAEGIKILRNTKPNQIIELGGRNFTVDELNRILTTGGGQTVYRAALPSADQQRLLNAIRKGDEGSLRTFWETFKGLPQSEDYLFRYAALKMALREGRTIEEAIALARRSMFDVSDITKNEKALKRLALFYGFQRNSIVNAIKNLTRIKGIKRLAKTERFRQNLTDLLMGDEGETRTYSPSYAQTRVILNKIGFDPERGKSLVMATPPLQSLDAIYSLADVIKGQPQGLFGGAIRSEYKALLGVEDKFSIDPEEIPAEHIAILGLNGGDPLDAVNFILRMGGASETSYAPETRARRGVSREGREGRYRIPLTTPKQQQVYRNFMTAMAYSGIASPVSDFARAMQAEGTKMEDLSAGERSMLPEAARQVGYVGGAVTPITYLEPEQQAYYDRLSRLKQLQALNATLEKDETERMREDLTPEQRQTSERVEGATEQIGEARQTVRRQIRRRTKAQIVMEMQSLRRQMASDPANALVYTQRLIELGEEIKRMNEAEAAQQRIE